MAVDYDPYSHEAMKDPYPLYKKLREEPSIHYMEKYNAWAISRFEDVWAASLSKDVTFTSGQTPGQVLLGEPVPMTFMTMDGADQRAWRGLIRGDYTPEGIKIQAERIRATTREILAPLLEKGEFDVYADLSNRVTTINAGYMLGMNEEDAITCRGLIDGMLLRDEGQIGGGSEANQQAFGALFGFLMGFIANLRANPDQAKGHTKTYMEAEIDGKKLNDEELTFYLFSLLVTGSETTPITVAGTMYNLFKNPEILKEVQADISLAKKAFDETVRYDQPTNMLARKAGKDMVINGQEVKEGQGLLFLYASACRDESEYPEPEKYDIHRENKRTLTFGHGAHKCLGVHMGTLMGTILLEEIISNVGDYTIDEADCERLYGEHLSGFGKVVIKFAPTKLK